MRQPKIEILPLAKNAKETLISGTMPRKGIRESCELLLLC